MAKLGNVVPLNPRDERLDVSETIYLYLARIGQTSPRTKETYERHIRDFFLTMRNKKVGQLQEEDLVFSQKQILSYQIELKKQHKGSTVNNAISAISGCYKQLQRAGFEVDPGWFNLDRYDESDSIEWDTLSHEEVVQIIDLVKATRKGNEKALLIRLAFATAYRKESLLSLEWSQFPLIDGIRYVKVLGKGNKWAHKKISDALYEELMEHKKTTDGDKVFKLTNKTIRRMMDFIRENMDFGERRIVFHSFKKASIDEVSLLTDFDLKTVQLHGDHSKSATTLDRYMKKRSMEDLIVVDIDQSIPIERLDELTHDELLGLVKSLDRATLIKLLKKEEKLRKGPKRT